MLPYRIIRLFFLALIFFFVSGCVSDADYEDLKQKYDAVVHENISLKDGRAINEDRLAVALACTSIPIDLCPAEWLVDFEAFAMAGYQGLPTWRYWSIILIGFTFPICLLAFVAFLAIEIFNYANSPKRKHLLHAEQRIALANKKEAELKEYLRVFDQEESKAIIRISMRIKREERLAKDARQKKIEEEEALKYFIAEATYKKEALNKEIETLIERQKLFGKNLV